MSTASESFLSREKAKDGDDGAFMFFSQAKRAVSAFMFFAQAEKENGKKSNIVLRFWVGPWRKMQ